MVVVGRKVTSQVDLRGMAMVRVRLPIAKDVAPEFAGSAVKPKEVPWAANAAEEPLEVFAMLAKREEAFLIAGLMLELVALEIREQVMALTETQVVETFLCALLHLQCPLRVPEQVVGKTVMRSFRFRRRARTIHPEMLRT